MNKEERLPTFEELMLDDSEGDAIDCLEYLTIEDEPKEDDYVINGNLICQYGRILANLVEWDNIERFIRKHAKANNFFPSVWMLSDHGNYHLVTDFNYDL